MSSPAGCSSQSNWTPVASSTRRVASTSSGPVPSPGMIVTLCAMRRAMLSVGWRGSFLPMSATIDVLNQAPPLSGYDPLEQNRPLDEGLEREGGGWARDDVAAFGRRARQPEVQDWARLANENPPRLRTHDRYGRRVDEVEFHPAWHELLTLSIGHRVHALPWLEDRPGAHVARAALFLLSPEAGHGCPLSMTYAVVPVLRRAGELGDEWIPRLTSTAYDPRFIPAAGKDGAL